LTDLFLRNQVDQIQDTHIITSEVSDEYISKLTPTLFEVKEKSKGVPNVPVKTKEELHAEIVSGMPEK